MNVWDRFRQRLARAIAPARAPKKRSFAGAAFNRTLSDWILASTSADAEVRMGLRTLRNRARSLVRDNDYAKNACRVITNNVVGTGIDLQTQVMMRRKVNGKAKLDDAVNDAIEAEWRSWCRPGNCDVTGGISFGELQRLVVGALPQSGEILVRKVRQKFGKSRVPFALEVIESDQLVDEWNGRVTPDGNEVRMGVEVDQFKRPVAYWLYPRHPGDFQFVPGQIQTNRLIRVPAEEVYHLYVRERPGQSRGVPWFHTTITRLRHMGGYEESEVIAARASAAVMGFIQSPEVADPTDPASGADDVVDGERVYDFEPGLIKELAPGEAFNGWNPTRPNANADPFLRLMLRGVAAGIGCSYEAISKDYSQSNYSSSRLALLDDRDNYRVIQNWLVDHFLQQIYEDWLEAAVLSGALSSTMFPEFFGQGAAERYCTVRWKLRGWDWIDPFKEVQADKLAVRSGLMSLQDALAKRGVDVEDVFKQRRQELDMQADYDLVLETDPSQVDDKGIVQASAPLGETDDGLAKPTGEPDGDEGDGAQQQPQQQQAGQKARPPLRRVRAHS